MIDSPDSTLLDRYRVVQKLGQGRSGAVYEAIDRASGERIALKELRYVNPKTLAHFKQEFRAMQEVHHPNLVRLDALFEDRGKWVIAMELVEGTDLLSYLYVAEGSRCFDERQLRDAFLQLAKGLEALHAAGIVHRDLKPANVRVTPEGRVVLLDFGLAAEIDPRGAAMSMRPMGMGTLAYMAPEQAEHKDVGPPADWYAFGVCLYEAMSGIRPIDADNPRTLLAAKRLSRAAPVSSHAPSVPVDLDRLCVSLLQITPEVRPTARAVRRVLQGSSPLRSSLPALASINPGQRGVFQGREQELQLLEQALVRAQAGSFQVVLIEGDSGIGKSALVECFMSMPREVVVLRSRCYENELLAYKAFDGAMDGLSDCLSKLPPEECAALVPPNASVLCRMFPALEVIPALAKAPVTGLAADPSAQRLEAFAVFSQLLARLSAKTPVVFVIDDLQWADAESFRLLQAWLSAGPARCLVLATVRPRMELEGEAAEGIAALRELDFVRDLTLTGLPHASAMALARSLIGGPLMPDKWFEAIVKESAGHPLFLTVLARFAESHDPTTSVDLSLDSAITARIDELTENARRLLETVAVAGSPLSAPLCGRAAGLSENELGRLATDLCRQKLLRRRRAGEIAIFHDRIRRVTLEALPLDQARTIHRELAAALASQEDADAARLARHYEGGGELGRALGAYAAAGDKALSLLAFTRADLLYGRALAIAALLEVPPKERVALQIARGHALARCGRSAQAARCYLEAAQAAKGEEKTRLRIWAAQHLLQSAHVEEGMQAARSLLSEIGVPMPTGFTATLARLLWDRTAVSMSEIEVPTQPRPIGPKERMQLDALWNLAMPVSWLDPLASVGLTTRHLRLARAAGEPTHMGRALAEEAFTRQFRDPHHRKLDILLQRARELCEATGDPALDLSVSFREATVALVTWNLPRARERLEHAQRIGTERCPDQPWLLTNVRITLGSVYNLAAEHAQLAACTGAWLIEARDRDDQFALSLIESVGMGHLRHLMAGDPDQARAQLASGLSPWPREPFSYAHYGEALGVMHSELVRGGDGAYRWLQEEGKHLGRAFMLKVGFGRASLITWRARASLGAHASATSRTHANDLLAEASAQAELLEKVELRAAAANALSLRAQVAALQGDVERALISVRVAHSQAESNRYVLLSRTMDYLRGLLEGGDQGAKLRADTLAYFEQQGWKHPRRALGLLCPALDSLESRKPGG